MKFKVVPGKNFKNYIYINDLQTSKDFELLKIVEKVLFRSEYKPFMKPPITLRQSYFYNSSIFPAQFWQDVEAQLYNITGTHYILEDEDYLYNNEFEYSDFKEFVNNLYIPDNIKTDDKRYEYQQESAYLAIQNKIGRIEIGTSGGKTFITYLYCRFVFEKLMLKDSENNLLDNQKILIIVPSKLLVTQLIKDFAEYQQNESQKLIIESIYSGSKKIIDAHIVCGTFQSLYNYEQEYFDDFRFIICDEVHRAKIYSIRAMIFNKIMKGEYFFGMSGTYPKYNTIDYLHIVSMFGPLLYKKPIASLIDDKISVPIKLHIIRINYDKDIQKEYDNQMQSAIVALENRYYAEKKFFQTFEPRTKILIKLLKGFTSNSLILVNTIEYCQLLEKQLNEAFNNDNIEIRKIRVIYEKIKNREEIIQEFRNTSEGFILIGTYGTMSTGVNIKNIEQIYFIDGGKSEIRIRQSLGRGIRLYPNKNYCDVFDFYDCMKRSSFAKQAKERMNIYKEQKLEYRINDVQLSYEKTLFNNS